MSTNQTITFTTFFLAMIGYAGLTSVLIISIKKSIPRTLLLLTSLVILAHVIMIWMNHYQLDFSYSIRNGYTGFLIFHSALIIIIVSNFVNELTAGRLIKIAFAAVTTGAAGAVFRYEIVAIYKLPVIICACSGLFFLILSFKKNKL